MQTHKLVAEIIDEDYALIALHSAMDEIRMVYLLNKILDFRFCRTENDIEYRYSSFMASYFLYKYHDPENMINYFLINNKFKTPTKKVTTSGLFDDTEQIAFLLPELKKVDYFLKIEENVTDQFIAEFLLKLKELPQLNAAYRVQPNLIKNQENLIFE